MSVINIINFSDLGSWFDTSQVIETGKINPNLPKVLSTPLTTIPTVTGNTTNKNQIVTGSDGLKYFIDFNGNAALFGSDITIISNNDGTVSFTKNSVTSKSIKSIDQLNPITGAIDYNLDKLVVFDASANSHVSIDPLSLLNPKLLSSTIPLTGTVTGSYEFGIDITTGLQYYKNLSGNWQAFPVTASTVVTDLANGLANVNSGTGGSEDMIRPVNELSVLSGVVDIVNDKVLLYDASTSTHVSVTPDKIGITTPATTTQLGLAQLATILETETGADTSKVLTPADGEAVYFKKSALNAKGDIISASADNTPSILSVGTNGQSLVADSTTTTGLKWSSITGNVRYGTIAPTILGTDLKGDIYLTTTSGDNTTPVVDSYVYDGSIWIKLSSATTHTLTSAINTITSTVNGIVATANAVNSVSNTSSANTILTTVNGVAGSTVPIINSNTLGGNTASGIVSTINGVAATLTPISGIITNNLGFDSTGAIVKQTSTTDWNTVGNASTVQATNFIGTTDNIGLSLRTNNVIRQTITNTGNIGLGTITPLAKLEIDNTTVNTSGLRFTRLLSTSPTTVGQAIGVNTTGDIVTVAMGIVGDDEITATANQLSFTLTVTPQSKLIMFINGIRLPKASYSFVGTTVTYVPASNDNYIIKVGDRINFNY